MSEPAKEHIVCLDTHVGLPPFNIPATTTYYASTSPNEVASRIATATVLITTAVKLHRDVIMSAPKLRLVTAMGTGYDHVDLAACKERGITVCNVPAQNIDSVSEHAIAIYFAVKRQIERMGVFVRDGTSWAKGPVPKSFGRPPRTCGDEVAGIVGYGGLGTLPHSRFDTLSGASPYI